MALETKILAFRNELLVRAMTTTALLISKWRMFCTRFLFCSGSARRNTIRRWQGLLRLLPWLSLGFDWDAVEEETQPLVLRVWPACGFKRWNKECDDY